ncbi:hypothetical protein B0J12DRAFT_758465 [Macrophomina phaseolina]|uniref:ubiquitinyl hydrolase 1 n=1 Tax=Macrophomina phaseolina TaxID=35725 RepID=A0ABQ8GUN7_9PEZI|nr:hypothetical protein B0J12DRAFT_758465 [Macrophomina phaseolina]
MNATLSEGAVDFLIDHVILPAKLPQNEDQEEQEREGENLILRLVLETAELFASHCDFEKRKAWKPVLSALKNLTNVTKENAASKATLAQVLCNLEPSDAVCLRVKAQNAGLVIFRPDDDDILIHAFEASAQSQDVMETGDRLAWVFPGRSVAFKSHLLRDKHFVQELALMIYKISHEPVELSMPTTRKAQSNVPEERETAHPKLVTENFMAVLEALGDSYRSPTIHKHIRDDVNWDHSKLPWRRSPFWLVIRVTIQLLLTHAFPGNESRIQYKNLMALVISKVCDMGIEKGVSADVQMIVIMKAARRLSKLGTEAFDFVEQSVQTAVQAARHHLDLGWAKFQETDSRSVPKLSREATQADCSPFLSSSREYLRKAMIDNEEQLEPYNLRLSDGPRLDLNADGLPNLPRLGDSLHQIFLLADFEQWIMEELRPWMEGRAPTEGDCAALLMTMRYRGNPRALSVILLVILEIWVLYPMLRQYSPEIPWALGEPLLLPHLCQLKSLKRIEDHLASRFRDANSDSFSRLRDVIEPRKQREWEEKSGLYRRLQQEAAGLDHSYSTNYWGDKVHRGDCHKCSRDNEANALTIHPDEWPLPADDIQLKADFGRPEALSGEDVHERLLTYKLLEQITLGSAAKDMHFPISLEAVCLPNGLKYEDQQYSPTFHRHWPYSNLQDFVDTSSCTPNEAHPHEFRIQWLNILRELGSADLSFNAEEVHILIRQAVLQAGARNKEGFLRQAHAPFKDPAFSIQLLGLLEHHLATTLAVLGLRVLTLGPESSLLRGVRQIALKCLHKCFSDEESQRLRTTILKSALTCRMTFDLDPSRAHLVLADDCDVASFVESSIHRHESSPIRLSDLPNETQNSLLMDRRIARSMEAPLRALIERSSSGINAGIKQACELTGFAQCWDFLPGAQNRWATCEITAELAGMRQRCHYKLLTGELLLDGRGIGKLPREYTATSIYRRVFGPVHFGMRNGELIIEAVAKGRHFRLIPHAVLDADLPKNLTDDFVHWMNIATGEIEFSRTATLHFSPYGRSHMDIRRRQLVDQGSQLGRYILDILQALEDPRHIIVTASQDVVEAEIPRFRLRFFSKELGAIVDQEQDIGVASPISVPERSVVIPGDHKHNLRFMHYWLDEKLSQLRSGSGAAGKLFIAYLHAHTGTEEALRILREQSLRTSTPIDEDAMMLLNEIAALTPKRVFYPKRLRRMQTLAQHEDFYALTEGIVTHAAQFAMLHDGSRPGLSLESRGEPHLLHRAANRNSSVRNTSLGARQSCDQAYNARDGGAGSDQAHRAYEIAALVRRWPQRIDVVQDLASQMRRCGKIEGYGQTLDASTMTCNDILELLFLRQWGSIYNLCRYSRRETDQYKLMWLFGMIVFAQPESVSLVRTLLGIASSGRFTRVRPSESSYDLGLGEYPSRGEIRSAAGRHARDCSRRAGEDSRRWNDRRAAFLAERLQQLELITRHVVTQWPCDAPSLPNSESVRHVNTQPAYAACTELFTAWNKNRKFMLHIETVQSLLAHVHSGPVTISRPTPPLKPPPCPERRSVAVAPSLMDLLRERAPPALPTWPLAIQMRRPHKLTELLPGRDELGEIMDGMRSNADTTRRDYGNDFHSSLVSFDKTKLPETPEGIIVSDQQLLDHRAEISNCMDAALCSITRALSPESISEVVLHSTGLWPRIKTVSLLLCLSARRIRSISDGWKHALLSLGEIVSLLQRSERLLACRHRNDVPGRRSWKAEEFPDWLLIEVENNLTIRDLQADVARKMIQPDGETNSALQLNMGEGKSSVIVPMQLARLVQTQHLLSQRLCGLKRLDEAQIDKLRHIFRQCMEEQGILTALPEHMMSFRLMGRERLQTQPSLGWSMICLEKWLGAHCRDVLDESDEILDPRFQLQMMDGQPDRWIMTQRLLALFAEQARRLHSQGSRSYPMITFLDHTIGHTLLELVVKEIGRGNLIGAALDFIWERSIRAHEFSGTDLGLIAHNVLQFAFQQKRWLVNYGLDLSRCMIAVPAEFGHPDVAIILTCMSYYYTAFDLLFKESDPPSEYARGAADCLNLPIRSLYGINLDDERSWEEDVFPHLRFSKSAADFFMAMVVFPHEGKEFPAKMSSSAWDIPSQARLGGTTGFSGTNDNKFLLPTSIQQHDLPVLHHTNAMVVNLLLRDENRGYIDAKSAAGKRLNVRGLLRLVCSQQPRIGVLIDVGAQVLESNNYDVAKDWLQLSPQTEAAPLFSSPFHRKLDRCVIYLDEVHTRGVDLSMPANTRAAVTLGPRTTKDRLVQACMRMRKLGCGHSLVFLGPPDVHQEILHITEKRHGGKLDSADVVRWCFEQTCRATDAMKPLWIMQGLEHCRRQRLCVAFLEGDSPAEIILDKFCSSIQEPEGRPLGEMYGAGSEEVAFRACLTDKEARKGPTVRLLLSQWDLFKECKNKDWALQEEQEREIAHEVEQEKELQRPPPAEALPHKLDPELRHFVQTGRFRYTAHPPFPRAFESLQQTSAYRHLHANTVAENLYVTNDFVRVVDGKTTPHSADDEFIRPVKWILSSSLAPHLLLIISPYKANALLPELRASSKVRLHVYSAKISKTMQPFGDLSFYAVSSCKKAYIPNSLLHAQLDLFAGCLFFEGHASYRTVCDFLGIVTNKQADNVDVRVGSDGFANRKARVRLNWLIDSPFERTPIPFFRALTGIRRKGFVYSQTHFGHLLAGSLLTEENFSSV